MSLVNFSACLARRYAAAYEAKPIQTAVTSGVVIKTGADVLAYGPLVYLPAYTLAMGAAANKSLSDAAMTLRRQWREATACSVAILGPAQAVNFSVVPYGLRLPFMLGAAFVYNAALSSINLRALSASS